MLPRFKLTPLAQQRRNCESCLCAACRDSRGACGPEEGLCRWYKGFMWVSRFLSRSDSSEPNSMCTFRPAASHASAYQREGVLLAARPRPGLPGPARGTALPKVQVLQTAPRRAARRLSQPGNNCLVVGALSNVARPISRLSHRNSGVEGNQSPLSGLFSSIITRLFG